MEKFEPSLLVSRRMANGLSQRALSRKAGLAQSVIAELERGKHPPSENALAKLAQALGIDPRELFTS